MKDKRKITIGDVAKKAQVGIATVSRAINNSGEINPETRVRILKIIEEMGFSPNTAAQSLKIRQTKQIALAVPDIRNAIIPDIAWSVEQTAKQYDYRVIQINTSGNPRAELDTIRDINRLHVDGVLIMPLAYPKTLSALINNCPLPVSILNYGKRLHDGMKADIVRLSRMEGKLVMDHLHGIGRTRIAYAGPSKKLIEDRYIAYEESLTAADEALVFLDEELSTQMGERAADSFLGLENRPDAIYAANDMVAIGLINRFKKLGIRVPEDIAVVGIDNNPMTTLIEPQVSSVSIMGAEAASLATELLLKRIVENPQREYETVQLEPRLIVRQSSLSVVRV
ncbi:LacI family DNA-binding transcriptional regulator [Gorillibacterium timonense]|uniref:LacI family DNA-binding transcriptional regulator n=1 Tax=Gorillibacterium timonense TaxID=1689269 RepID=UPI00071DB138|nr:LacI family DNA-binding transcriptional regulator [Gorillibacterium timonense]